MPRNLSPQQMFIRLAREHTPRYRFAGTTAEDFGKWKAEALPRVIACLGEFPPAVPANPELSAEWEHDGLIKQQWLIDVGPHISAAMLINRPASAPAGKRLPAILCCHGHGEFGKEAVMGNDSSPELRDKVARHNYAYGHAMAKLGYVTFAIDWIGFGERNDSRKPHFNSASGGRDWCNLLYLSATMLGTTSLAINVAHGKAAVDFACSQPFVDPDRLGVMGLSGGGTMTVWMALCDERLRAAENICYSDLWPNFGFAHHNWCGMQVAPGLFGLVDLPDLQGLIAPRPLLVDIGVHDTCFTVDAATACFRRVEAIYAAAGASENLELDLFPGEHSWGGHRSEGFFRRHLGA